MSFSKSHGKKEGGYNASGAGNAASNGLHQKHQNRGNSNNSSNNKKWTNNSAATRTNHASTASQAASNDLIVQDPNTTKNMHDRMIYILGNATGTTVEVTVKDGCKFRGILHGASTEGDLGVALKLVRKIYDPSAPIDKDKTNPNPIINTILIFPADLVEVNVIDVDFNSTQASAANRNTFKTDTDISRRLDIKERELHKWAPTDDENGLGLSEHLESSPGGSWDQFAANEKLFGLKTDFDEEIYTTPLNRSAPGFKDREKRAIEVANEINKTSTTNPHMLEERGVSMDDSGLNEEDRYGAVVRDLNPNKHIPSTQQQQQSQKDGKLSSNSPLNRLITTNLPKNSSFSPSPIANLPTTRSESSQENPDKNTSDDAIEATLATNFKRFAMVEKDKLTTKKLALQQKKRDGIMSKLMAFHKEFKLESPVPVDLLPLLSNGKNNTGSTGTQDNSSPPTNNADKNKSDVSPALSTAAANTASSPITKSDSVVTPAPTNTVTQSPVTKSTTAASTTSTSSNGSSFKFNVKASSFKPNPSAVAFVPGGASSVATVPSHNPEETNTFFVGRQFKKGGSTERLTMQEAFSPCFVQKDVPASVRPTWPFGHKPYRVQFNQFVNYGEEMFTGYPMPVYNYNYPHYRYPQYPPGMPQIAGQPIPYVSPPFVHMHNVPSGGYSPQMGFAQVSSPQMSPMMQPGMPPQGMSHQGYPYPVDMPMRYTPQEMTAEQMSSPHHHHKTVPGPTSANNSRTDTPPPA